MDESTVLQKDEQDQLGVVLANLRMAAPIYGVTAIASLT